MMLNLKTKAIPLLSLLATGAVALVLSCGKLKELPTDPGGGTPPPIDPSATFTRVNAEVLMPTCASIGCHDRLGRQEGLVLTPADLAYSSIVNVASVQNAGLKRVQPGDPDNSYVYRKVLGTGITGERMPQGRTALTADQIALIRNWILRGAPND